MKKYLPEGHNLFNSANRQALASPVSLAEAAARGDILEAKVSLCDFEHNLIVDLGCMKGVIPRVEGAIGIAEGSVRDIALISRVGKAVSFIITGIKTGADGKLRAILSRRTAQEKCQKDYVSKLEIGRVIDARITRLEKFGAFCDIGCGIPALLPIDAISVSRISHPADRFTAGDDIKVIVKSVDSEGRVSLSMRELLGTWEENAAMFSLGETVSGIIRSVEEYGVFVELTPNLAGLAEPFNDAKPGMTASCYIKNLLPEKMKVKLIIIDAFQEDYHKKTCDYFYSGEHIEKWRYSPKHCEKMVETVFTDAKDSPKLVPHLI